MQVNNCKEFGLVAAVIRFGQQMEAFNNTGACSGQQLCEPAATLVSIRHVSFGARGAIIKSS